MSMNFGKLNFAVSFNYGTAIPADARSYFESYDDAVAAAASAVEAGSSDSAYYIGMPIVVVEDEIASFYQIAPDGTLQPVGASVVGDDVTIEIVDGVASVKGASAAIAGQQPRISANGGIEWYTPDTSTVAGLSDTVAGHTSDIATLSESIVTLNGTGDGSVAKAITEAINTFSSTVTDNDTIDTFAELVAYVAEHGSDVTQMLADIAQNSDDIDSLETLVGDTAVSSQIAAAILDALKIDGEDKYALATELSALITRVAAAETAIAGMEAGAQVNVIEIIKLNGVAATITGKAVDIPLATAQAAGLVKSSTAENHVAVANDGTMSINSVNINKLVQTDGDTLILDGGSVADLV